MRVIKMENQPAANEYHGCGKAWVAIRDDCVVGIRYMDSHAGCHTGHSPAALARAGRVRYCPASVRAADEINTEIFLAWRDRARAELATLGEVKSGMLSCWELILRE